MYSVAVVSNMFNPASASVAPKVKKYTILEILKEAEGYSADPYKDSLGYWTIGYGTKISSNRNLRRKDLGIAFSKAVAELMLKEEITILRRSLLNGIHAETYKGLTSRKQDILISMAYQMGINGLYNFRKMWVALEYRNYALAKKEALNSLWAKQTPTRARHHAGVLGESERIWK